MLFLICIHKVKVLYARILSKTLKSFSFKIFRLVKWGVEFFLKISKLGEMLTKWKWLVKLLKIGNRGYPFSSVPKNNSDRSPNSIWIWKHNIFIHLIKILLRQESKTSSTIFDNLSEVGLETT